MLKEKNDNIKINNNLYKVSYNKEEKELNIHLNDENITLNIETKGDLNIKCKSFNLIVEEDFSVDSLKPLNLPSIFLNSRMAKQIRNLFHLGK